MTTILAIVILAATAPLLCCQAFVLPSSRHAAMPYSCRAFVRPVRMSSNDNESDETNDEGVSMAADFFKSMKERNIQLEQDDFLDDDEEEEDEDEEDEEVNYPQGAIDAFTGSEGLEELAGNSTLTNKQVYSELKERVLESAGGFVEFVGGADDEEDDDDEEKEKTEYKTPEQVPDPALTAGEVVTTVLDALLHNNVPTTNRGIQVLFGYSSPGSAIANAIEIEGMTPTEYAEFLKETEYTVLFQHVQVIIEKGDYSFDKKKAFFTARLQTKTPQVEEGEQQPPRDDFVSVNFILSRRGDDDDEEDCWLIDSMLIRPQGMRRRRRR